MRIVRPLPSPARSTHRKNPSDPKERAHFWLPGSEATSSHELLDSPLADRMYVDADARKYAKKGLQEIVGKEKAVVWYTCSFCGLWI